MSENTLLSRLGFWAQVLFIGAYVGVLSTAMFVFQFALGEMPCPLCITQRMGMIASALGATYIVVEALRGTITTSKYLTGLGIAIIGAVVGAAMSTRQILLHIMPDDPGYGTAILGLHLYTWALVSFIVVVVFVGVLLIIGTSVMPTAPTGRIARTIAWVIVWAFFVTIVLNMVVVFVEEGFNWFLPDDPTGYELWRQLGFTQ